MSIIVYFVAKKFASKGWVLKVSHFRMNNITIIYIIVVILVMGKANKRITVLFGTKRKAQYHAGYHEELTKRYCHFGKVWKEKKGKSDIDARMLAVPRTELSEAISPQRVLSSM